MSTIQTLRSLVHEGQDLSVGDVCKVDVSGIKRSEGAMAGPWIKLIQKEVKNGNGRVVIRKISGGRAEIYGEGTHSYVLGAVEVPLTALTKVA